MAVWLEHKNAVDTPGESVAGGAVGDAAGIAVVDEAEGGDAGEPV